MHAGTAPPVISNTPMTQGVQQVPKEISYQPQYTDYEVLYVLVVSETTVNQLIFKRFFQVNTFPHIN